jgi:hypothetical protein
MAKSQGVPPAGWESSLLQQLGDPDTQASEQFFDDWAATEHAGSLKTWGTNGTGMAFNPFSTSLDEPGAVAGNSVPIWNYPNWTEGEAATVSMIEQTNMSPIQQALHSGTATEADLEQAEGQTPWGHESGWASGTPRFGSGSSSGSGSPLNLNGWQGLGYGPTPVASTNPGSSSSSTPASTALLTAAPWGGLYGSQIEEAVFFLLGAALVIVGLVITFKSGNEDNAAPAAAPVAKEASHAEEGAELAAA